MMAGLFILFFLSLLLIYWQRSTLAFILVIINLILSFLMLLSHSPDLMAGIIKW